MAQLPTAEQLREHIAALRSELDTTPATPAGYAEAAHLRARIEVAKRTLAEREARK